MRIFRTDISDIPFFADMGYSLSKGGTMSRPFMSQEEEKKMMGLLASLKGADGRGVAKETVEIKRVSAHELVGLIELLLQEQPVVLDEDLTPAEAAKIAQVSRPLVMHLLKTGKLKGYTIGIGKHRKVKRDSLLKYMQEREELANAFGEMDKHGFGLD